MLTAPTAIFLHFKLIRSLPLIASLMIVAALAIRTEGWPA